MTAVIAWGVVGSIPAALALGVTVWASRGFSHYKTTPKDLDAVIARRAALQARRAALKARTR